MFDIKDLLKIEEDSEILKFKIPELDIPIWLYLRFDLFWYIQRKKIGLEEPHVKINPYKLQLNLKIKYLFDTIRYQPFRRGNSKILIFGASINNVLENSTYYNRLYDPMIELLGKEVRLLESSNKFSYYSPRFVDKVFYSDVIPIVANLLSNFYMNFRKFNNEVKDYENELNSFINYIEKKCKTLLEISVKDYFKNRLGKIIQLQYKLKIQNFMCKKLLKIVKPKLVIIEDAHYGGYSNLIKLCKNLDIKVAEFQHGYIGNNHLAYNFHENIKNQIKDYFPDYMLYWGEYWAMNSDIPGEKKIIGFPYLEKKHIDLQNKYQNKDIYILFVSGGNIPFEYVKLGKMLKSLYPNKKLVFRPHPSERPAINERYNELINNGWEIDNKNLYDTLSKTEICISLEVSTVLYEATVFCKKVFLINSRASEPYLENDFPLIVIKDYDKIYEYIENIDYNQTNQDIRNMLFEPNWENNFINFINEIGIKYVNNNKL